jgi:hypothetical protein
MATEAARLMARVGADISELEQKMAQADRVMKQAAGNMTRTAKSAGDSIGRELSAGLGMVSPGLASIATGGAIVGGLALVGRQVAHTTAELAHMGAQSDRLARGFERQWGEDAPAAFERMRRASQGAISDMDLYLSGTRAKMLQVTDDVDTLGRLLEVAEMRGRDMGVSTKDAFDYIVTGIGRISPMILDNLGILTGGAMEEYAASIGKAAGELTDIEKRQALVNRVLADTTPLAYDAAVKWERYHAAQVNLRAAVGQSVDAMLEQSGALEQVAQGMDAVTARINESRDAAALIAQMSGDLLARMHELNSMPMPDEPWWMRMLRIGSAERQIASSFALPFESAIREIEGLNAAYRSGAITKEVYIAKLIMVNEKYTDLLGIMPEVTATTEHVSMATLHLAEAQAIAASEADNHADALDGVKSAMDKLAWSPIDQLRTERAIRGLFADRELKNPLPETQRGRAGVDTAAREMERQMQAIRSMAEGLLSPTYVTDIDMARTRLGMYTDQWDEYIRRVRSAATDAESAWKHLIPTDVLTAGSDAIKVWAHETEQAFYSGQMMDAINWGGFIEAASQKVAQDAAREQMVAEAMRRLAEAGIGGLGRADVAQMMGLPQDWAESGADRAGAIIEGMATVDGGKALTEQFQEQFMRQESEYVIIGEQMVTWIGEGAERGVPGITRALVRAILPELAELLNGRP